MQNDKPTPQPAAMQRWRSDNGATSKPPGASTLILGMTLVLLFVVLIASLLSHLLSSA